MTSTQIEPWMMFLILITPIILLSMLIVVSFVNQRISEKRYLIQSYMDRIELSRLLLDFLDKFIMDMCVREMETYKDTHDLALSNKSNISDLVSNTAIKVMNSLNHDMNIEGTVVEFKQLTSRDGFPWIKSMFSNSFLNQYVVDTTTFIMKRLLEKSIDEYEESK